MLSLGALPDILQRIGSLNAVATQQAGNITTGKTFVAHSMAKDATHEFYEFPPWCPFFDTPPSQKLLTLGAVVAPSLNPWKRVLNFMMM